MKQDVKSIYAQSSDIKSRTYLEYRKDMKKKAIVELEILPWLEDKLKNTKNAIKVEKSGGDKFIWFLRKGGITREPDFVVTYANKEKEYIEFQYSDREDLKFYDFKLSKVAKKEKNKRVPYKDRLFLYVMKKSYRYAFIEPEWILENGEIGSVPAWGSRLAFRVPKDKFESILIPDNNLKPIIEKIDKKISILNFQHELINTWEQVLSQELEDVIDKEKLLQFIPKTLEGFFKVCFIMDHLKKTPDNIRLWLMYILSYIKKGVTLKDISMIVYSIDFLYSKIQELKTNEISSLECKIKLLLDIIKGYEDSDGAYRSSKNESPINETRFALFSINIIEDLIQDMIYYYGDNLNPISKIFQNLDNLDKTFKFINDV